MGSYATSSSATRCNLRRRFFTVQAAWPCCRNGTRAPSRGPTRTPPDLREPNHPPGAPRAAARRRGGRAEPSEGVQEAVYGRVTAAVASSSAGASAAPPSLAVSSSSWRRWSRSARRPVVASFLDRRSSFSSSSLKVSYSASPSSPPAAAGQDILLGGGQDGDEYAHLGGVQRKCGAPRGRIVYFEQNAHMLAADAERGSESADARGRNALAEVLVGQRPVALGGVVVTRIERELSRRRAFPLAGIVSSRREVGRDVRRRDVVRDRRTACLRRACVQRRRGSGAAPRAGAS